ncbi:hypothetical protein [Pedobacter arcticus]|uniref:hypothetical protein n=1 Tax=Pedobacter arcticus TaxID=752140 RepID=UPI0002DFB6BD|nr:hypothetical protein [Pedobacter arcticus]
MKSFKTSFKSIFAIALVAMVCQACTLFDMDLQKKYEYKHDTLDPNINITARQFLEDRSYGVTPADTVFKWMRKGLEYAEIDLAEYEKPGRTFFFLHNEGVRVISGGKVTAGLWFDFPIVTSVNPTTGVPVTRPATKWEDYPKQDVKNYFLYLITEGDYNFDKLTITNKAVQTLLPPNQIASKQSYLGFLNDGKGFDQEGKMNLKLVNNNDLAPIQINDKTNDRSGGYIATNGIVHVYGMKSHYTIYPFR